MNAHVSEAAVEAGFAVVLAAHRLEIHDFLSVIGTCSCDDWKRSGLDQAKVTAAHDRHVAAALVASPEFAGMVVAAKAEALREAAEALNSEGLAFKPGGWGSNPADQQTIDVMVKAVHWLRDRAASHGEGK